MRIIIRNDSCGLCCGQSKELWFPLQDVLNSAGGMGALLPLLEQVSGEEQAEASGGQETSDLLGPELTSSRGPAGMLLPLGKSSGQCACSQDCSGGAYS